MPRWIGMTVFAGLAALLAAGVTDRMLTRFTYAMERGRIQASAEQLAQSADVASLQEVSNAFRLVANVARPAVAHIRVRGGDTQRAALDELSEKARELDERARSLEQRLEQAHAGEGKEDPASLMREWRELLREQEQLSERREELRDQLRQYSGSGVLIDKAGHVVTNNHVVNGRTQISVVLYDDREYDGVLVGADPKTDLAVLKIDATDLHPLTLGDSDRTEVGDWVLAIGAPFGLSQTVTHGIISAKGRADVVVSRDILYQDFLQTDAAINPGNSGGPLVNLRGEIIGINTAIATDGEAPSNAGVAFTIPSNLVKKVVAQLIESGAVARGWLGVSLAELDERDRAAHEVAAPQGVMIRQLYTGSPAERAGLQVEDVIVSVGGDPVASIRRLQSRIADVPPGRSIELRVVRDGQERSVQLEVARQPDDIAAFARGSTVISTRPLSAAPLRVSSLMPAQVDMLRRVNEQLAQRLDGARGAVVVHERVGSAGPAIDANELIVAMNDEPVASVAALERRLAQLAARAPITLTVLDGEGNERRVALRP